MPHNMASADLKMPAIFGDNMVLQAGMEVPVWGTATPGAAVTVECANQEVQRTVDDDATWSQRLKPMEYGGPYEFSVTTDDGDALVYSNVYIGEVWLGSGQSNMAMTVARSQNAKEEIANSENPMVRCFTTRRKYSAEPVDDVTGSWEMAGPDTTGRFTAAGYFFARELHKELDVAVGVINSSWGSTPARAWTRQEEIRSDETFAPLLEDFDAEFERQQQIAGEYAKAISEWRDEVEKCKREGKETPDRPNVPRGGPHRMAGVLYNGMIAPLAPYAIRGALWYQGEADARPGQAEQYDTLLSHLIHGWRRQWGQGAFRFLVVQLPNFRGNPQWPFLRESQLNILDDVSNTGLAITIDVGMTDNIHPLNKQAVGKRLALVALGSEYARDIVYSGPIFREMTIEGNTATIVFDHAGDGLVAKGAVLTGFEIAGPDKTFHPAQATINGSVVHVSSPEVSNPVAVRYAWAADPECNLYNSGGLPASPFRTDNWDQ